MNFKVLLCLVGLSQQSSFSFKFVPRNNRLLKKDAADFLFNLFLYAISIYYIPHNYVIRQAMPHAILQTHSALYPHRVLSVNAFDKSHNKRLSRQSQHFRKPLIIFPHLTRAKHRQITPKNPRFLHIHRRMETFLDSHSRFIQDPGCKPAVEKEYIEPPPSKQVFTESLAWSEISINFRFAQ